MMYSEMEYNYLSHRRINERVLQVLQKCKVACEFTETMLSQNWDAPARKKQLKLLLDCADICTVTAKYIARHSEYARPLALLCIQICQECGIHCLHQQSDELSHECGQICLDCSIECRKYAGVES